MPAHFTYKDALEQDPHLSRMIVAIHTAGTRQSSPIESPGHQISSSCRVPPPANQSLSHQPFPPADKSPTSQSRRPTPPTNEFLNHQPPPRHNRPLSCQLSESRTESPNHQLQTPLSPPRAEVQLAEDRSPTSPPANQPYSAPSDDGFSDGDIDHIINLFEDLSTDAGVPPPQVPSTPPTDLTKIYRVSSGMQSGMYDRWADAGHLSQGVPEAHVRKLWDRTPKKPPTESYVAYVVFEGLAPGIYSSWEEVKPLVIGIPGNIHKGFARRYEAERAYLLAHAMGAVRTLPRRGSAAVGPSPAAPTPQAIMDAFASMPDDFLGADWYVVYKGRRPGLYPAWNFAASQTLNVGCATHDKFPSKALATAAWVHAQAQPGRVQVLS